MWGIEWGERWGERCLKSSNGQTRYYIGCSPRGVCVCVCVCSEAYSGEVSPGLGTGFPRSEDRRRCKGNGEKEGESIRLLSFCLGLG
jgi:hypothetical protein